MAENQANICDETSILEGHSQYNKIISIILGVKYFDGLF